MADVILPLPDPEDWQNALAFVNSLPPNMRACRGARNHNFIDGNQLFGDENNGIIHTETECARGCKVVKVEDFDLARGYYITRPHYRYPRDYLIKSDEHGVIHPTDLGAASRIVNYYAQKGTPMPKPRRRRKSA